ncbi:MAG: WD40/YVTN/BNR-like repeat-containing protein, partial [Candidatus Eiseniibacteriota bacterium]
MNPALAARVPAGDQIAARRRIAVAILTLLLVIPSSSWAQDKREDQDKPRDDPGAREAFWRLSHGDARGEIPPNALVRAKEEMDRLRIAQQLVRQRNQKGVTPLRVTDAGISGWDWLGPGNIGGRIRAILFNPTNANTMWIGSVSGGMWRSDNGGASWGPVNDFMANLAITSIVMDPTNNSIMYAAT